MLDSAEPKPGDPAAKTAWRLGETILRATEEGAPPVEPPPRDKKRES